MFLDKRKNPKLKKVQLSKLWYNYTWNDEYKSAIIWVVTQKGFSSFIKKMIEVQQSVDAEMKEKRTVK